MKRLVAALVSVIAVFALASATANAAPEDRAPIPPPTDYWQDKGFILMAHQGGEWDFPPNTLFAYKSAMAIGADMIDMDAYVTADGKIVLTHDLDARKNSNLTDDMFGGRHDINELTLAELKTLDFAYKWSPRDGSASVPFRGIATGSAQPPQGFTANDFKIPTFDEVLAAFPDTPINIELKQVGALTPEEITETAQTMAGILADHPGHDENVIINSFGQEMLDAMHTARPQHKSYGGSLNSTVAYITGSPITPTPVAVEPPDLFNLGGNLVRTVPILKPWTDHDGYQIFVWGSDDDPAQDTDPFYAKLIEEGADSYNTPSPTTLAAYLCSAGVARPDGSPRCPEQECPEGQTGIAPDNCVDLPAVQVKGLKIAPSSSKVKAGGKVTLTLSVAGTNGYKGKATIRLKSSNRNVKVAGTVQVNLASGATVKKKVTVTAARKAKGKATITATSGKFSARSNLTVKAACQAKAKKNGQACGKTDHF